MHSVPGDRYVDLPYDPLWSKAVTCSSDHIYIAEHSPAGCIHIYTWAGLHVQSISKRQLGLQDE